MSKIKMIDGHWLWTERMHPTGYGIVPVAGRAKTAMAHRVAWFLFVGPISRGCNLKHACGQRSCCNPQHLRVKQKKIECDSPDYGEDARESKAYVPRRPADPKWKERCWRLVDRLMAAIVVDDLTSCWVWQNSVDGAGYGHLRVEGKTTGAHRLAWVMFVDAIPEASLVLHHCDNPLCCNPAHLFLGDHLANAADKIAKGRARNGQTGPTSPDTPWMKIKERRRQKANRVEGVRS